MAQQNRQHLCSTMTQVWYLAWHSELKDLVWLVSIRSLAQDSICHRWPREEKKRKEINKLNFAKIKNFYSKAPQKGKHRMTTWPSNFTPKYIAKRIESKNLDKYSSTRIHCIIILNSQKVKTARVTIKWTHKQTVVYTFNGISFMKFWYML